MDLTARKEKFIAQFMQIASPKKLKRFEDFLRSEMHSDEEIVTHTVQGTPLTKSQYISKIKEADDAIEKGEYTSVEDLEKEMQNWQYAKEKVSVKWSNYAKADLKTIYQTIREFTQSQRSAENVRRDIVVRSKSIEFVDQNQVDEYLGEPYRRMVVRNYKIVYRPEGESEIRILQIFDVRQDPGKMRKRGQL